MKLKYLFVSAVLALTSCAAPVKISYFQDTDDGNTVIAVDPAPIRLKPQDKISIIVNCKDGEVTGLFNLPYVTRYIGSSSISPNSSQGVAGYTIDSEGNIDFPVVGKIHMEGLTREEAALAVKDALTGKNLVKDPIVTVDYMNLTISVFGEVARPGRYPIDKDCVTILDALAQAGDLTIYGKRENIRVIRMEGSEQKTYHLNLCSSADILASPVYYVQQNDIIYIEPNDVRARQSTVNGNNIRSTSFWISLASLASSLCIMTISYIIPLFSK